jgi:hypothetical protein
MGKYEMIGQHRIDLDEIFFLAYAGGHRELAAKDQKEYDKILSLPFLLQRSELKKIPMEKNPNVIPLKGSQLLSFIKELQFVPFFDQFFQQSHLVKLTDVIIYEAIRQKSYELAMQNNE